MPKRRNHRTLRNQRGGGLWSSLMGPDAPNTPPPPNTPPARNPGGILNRAKNQMQTMKTKAGQVANSLKKNPQVSAMLESYKAGLAAGLATKEQRGGGKKKNTIKKAKSKKKKKSKRKKRSKNKHLRSSKIKKIRSHKTNKFS